MSVKLSYIVYLISTHKKLFLEAIFIFDGWLSYTATSGLSLVIVDLSCPY